MVEKLKTAQREMEEVPNYPASHVSGKHLNVPMQKTKEDLDSLRVRVIGENVWIVPLLVRKWLDLIFSYLQPHWNYLSTKWSFIQGKKFRWHTWGFIALGTLTRTMTKALQIYVCTSNLENIIFDNQEICPENITLLCHY